ncbi:hypothetical protein U1763_17645 [Sphingomonas sp. LB2R24]|nr:hypothetical protein [Sphingomonas sp. PP-F2F-A104-K0414]
MSHRRGRPDHVAVRAKNVGLRVRGYPVTLDKHIKELPDLV